MISDPCFWDTADHRVVGQLADVGTWVYFVCFSVLDKCCLQGGCTPSLAGWHQGAERHEKAFWRRACRGEAEDPGLTYPVVRPLPGAERLARSLMSRVEEKKNPETAHFTVQLSSGCPFCSKSVHFQRQKSACVLGDSIWGRNCRVINWLTDPPQLPVYHIRGWGAAW